MSPRRPEKPKTNYPNHLPRVVWVDGQGPVLHPTPLASQDERVLGLNLTRGCVHRCPFCSVRASPNYPGDSEVYLFANTVQRLQADLAVSDPLPRAVYISPATDPFPPLNEIQDEVAEVVRVLAEHGIESWLMTRGLIRPHTLKMLTRYRDHVRVTVALITVDRNLQRLLEPLAAPPRLRLEQITNLRSRGIDVKVVVDPLVPDLTDTRANLAALVQALAAVEVRHITAGYMFLREGIRENLAEALAEREGDRAVLDAFRTGPILSSEGLAAARYLPRGRRQRGYATLMALASQHGISVHVSGLTNPDFALARTTAPPPEERTISATSPEA